MTMFEDIKNKHKELLEDELLEIFILIEENTMSAKVEAISRYKNLYNMTNVKLANDKMKEHYKNFKAVIK